MEERERGARSARAGSPASPPSPLLDVSSDSFDPLLALYAPRLPPIPYPNAPCFNNVAEYESFLKTDEEADSERPSSYQGPAAATVPGYQDSGSGLLTATSSAYLGDGPPPSSPSWAVSQSSASLLSPKCCGGRRSGGLGTLSCGRILQMALK